MFIGLLVTLLIVGGMFFVLKPPGKGADGDSPLNSPISQAQQAVAQSQAAATKAEQATGSEVPAPSATQTPPSGLATQTPVKPVVKHPKAVHPTVAHHKASAPAIAAGDHSGKIFAAMAAKKVAVILFWTKGGADDNSVRRAVSSITGRHGVAVFTIPIDQVGKYPSITTGARIAISPTVLVIGPDHRYQEIVGYTDAAAITQAIGLARS